MKKFISMSLIVLIALFSAVPVYAVDETKSAGTQGEVTPQFTYISFLSPGLSIDSSGKATSVGAAAGYDNLYRTDLTVQLQKSNGGGWTVIKTWTASATGASIADVEGDYYVVRGAYRVCATAKIYNTSGTLLETQSLYSVTVTY